MEKTIRIIRGESKSKRGTNNSNSIPISLYSNAKKIPVEGVSGIIDKYEQYLKEKDECDKYHFIFTINVLASNVLFNRLTEIVYKEGSDECLYFGKDGVKYSDLPENVKEYCRFKHLDNNGKKLDREELIRDTTYSHKDVGPLVYHCGYDIFSNHLLRKNGFNIINKANTERVEDKKLPDTSKFNTLGDIIRDADGYEINGKHAEITGTGIEKIGQVIKEQGALHCYTYEDLDSLANTIKERLVERNGWFGFINSTGMYIKNYGNLSINKPMNNNKPCEQIDMYPDRELFSFSPKYNKYRKRPEKNWEYCLTYPYKNYYESDLVRKKMGNGVEVAGLKAEMVTMPSSFCHVENGRLEMKDGINVLFRTDVRNNLTTNDHINITMIYGSEIKRLTNVRVTSTGYNGTGESYYFSVMSSDIMDIDIHDAYKHYYKTNEPFEIRINKVDGGYECEYYIRLFRKIPNFDGTNVYDDGILDEREILEHIDSNFDTTVNTLAFSKNIYGDSIGQVIYGDDVNLNGLIDNLGRPLSEIFFTVIKNNKGYKEWYYGSPDDKRSSDVEYSHCFGKLTSGYDMPMYVSDYNVHKIHNVNISEIVKEERNLLEYISPFEKSPKNLEENMDDCEITIGGDTFFDEPYVFFGDIVEFSRGELKETVLEDACYRFNTVQREYTYNNGEEFHDFVYDEIVNDDYSLHNIKEGGEQKKDFTVSSLTYNEFITDEIKAVNKVTKIFADKYPFNISPEGYYYKPHNRIMVKDFIDRVFEGQHEKIETNYGSTKVNGDGTLSITANKQHYLTDGDVVILSHNKSGQNVYATLIDFDRLSFTIKPEGEITDLNDYTLYKQYRYKPIGSYEAGNGIYKYRKFKKEINLTKDDELYDMTFTNGKKYIHENLTLYLKRQDPYGDNGLNFGIEGYPSEVTNLSVKGRYKDISGIELITGDEKHVVCGIDVNALENDVLEKLRSVANERHMVDSLSLFKSSAESLKYIIDTGTEIKDFFESYGDD